MIIQYMKKILCQDVKSTPCFRVLFAYRSDNHIQQIKKFSSDN